MDNDAYGTAAAGRRRWGPEWFVVLPDTDDGAAVAARWAAAPQTVCHPSGRPWIVGDWDPADLRVGSAGRVRLATLGTCSADERTLTLRAGRVRDVRDVSRAVAGLAGSFHVLASVEGTTRVEGTLCGLRRVFHATVDRTVVAADRADLLAAATGGELDVDRLAMRLLVLTDSLPTAEDGAPLWRGVTAVPGDHYLIFGPDGRLGGGRRWSPPRAELDLAQGADLLGEALAAAVSARIGAGRDIGADLSGGLDSTSICYLANRAGANLTTFTSDTGDPRDEDPRWAEIAAAGLPGLRRIVAWSDELPLHYADLTDTEPPLDEPFPGIGDRPEHRAVSRLLLDAGVRLRLVGEGGDEVVTASETYLADLIRRRPLLGLNRLQAYRAGQRWSWQTVMRSVRRPSHRALLSFNARALTRQLPSTAGFPRDDMPAVRAYLPPWVTRDTLETVRAVLRRSADDVGPVAPTWAQDDSLRMITYSGQLNRGLLQYAAALGLPMSAPFLDDRVINAALAVRPEESAVPGRYKPLLVEAMAGVVPRRCLSRISKSDGAALVITSIKKNRDKLLALCEDSALATLGLIDVGPLRAACSTSLWSSDFMTVALSPTFSCERWLRDLDAHPVGGRSARQLTHEGI